MGTNVLQTRRSRLRRVASLLLMTLVVLQVADDADAGFNLISSAIVPSSKNPKGELAAVELFTGNDDLLYFQKWETDDDEGSNDPDSPGIGTYTFNPPGNVGFMDITWDLTSVDFELAYVLVKGANTWTLFGVTLDEVKASSAPHQIFVSLSGTPEISHVSFFGVESASTVTPEPSTLFFGSGLAACACIVGAIRARRASKA